MDSNRTPGEFKKIMNFEATVAGKKRLLNVSEEDGHYVVTIDGGKPIHADFVRIASGYNLLIQNRSYIVSLTSTNNHYDIQIDGRLFRVELVSELKKAQKRLKGAELSGAGMVVARMPGKIVKILVRVGDDVHDGQSVIIMEAMKMENELRVLSKGKIKEIRIKEGDSVEAGAILVVLE